MGVKSQNLIKFGTIVNKVKLYNYEIIKRNKNRAKFTEVIRG